MIIETTEQINDPFNSFSDEEMDKDALVRSLSIVKDFALYFVVSEVSRVRPRVMDEVESRFPDRRIQRFYITKETTNLLHLLQDALEDPLPDIVFVSGFENVISASAEPRSHPILLNLNFTRNNFYALLPRPMVFWVPPFVLKAISQGAPDFVSVRSGVYAFALNAVEREEMTALATSVGQTKILGLDRFEREERIAEMQSLLADHLAIRPDLRNPLDEAQISNQLGLVYLSLGDFSAAEPKLLRALDIRREVLRDGDPTIAISLDNVAGLYTSQGRYAEAEPLYVEALSIRRRRLSQVSPQLAAVLNNFGELRTYQARYAEAELLFTEALSIARKSSVRDPTEIASILSNLATAYQWQGRYDEAEPRYLEALSVRRQTLPCNHPDIAQSLNNLSWLYQLEGRFGEADPLSGEALAILRGSLPDMHPDLGRTLNNLGTLYLAQGRLQEAEPLLRDGLKILKSSLPPEHPSIASVESNLLVLLNQTRRLGQFIPVASETAKSNLAPIPDHDKLTPSDRTLSTQKSRKRFEKQRQPAFKPMP